MTRVVSVFLERSAAKAAAERLAEQGVPRAHVHVVDRGVAPANNAAIEADELVTGGMLHEVGKLLDDLLGAREPPEKAATYEEAVRRRDQVAVIVEADDPGEVERAEAVLRQAGATQVARH